MSKQQRGKFRHLYGTARWQATRAQQLAQSPLCALCDELNRITAATVCDHVDGHPADETEEQFWSGPFQSLCTECHNGAKRQQERSGTLRGCHPDGTPFGRADEAV